MAGRGVGPRELQWRLVSGSRVRNGATDYRLGNKGDLQALVEGDSRLFNQYGVILLKPAKHPHLKATDGQAFVDWSTSAARQRVIGEYRLDRQQLFFPNANPRQAN